MTRRRGLATSLSLVAAIATCVVGASAATDVEDETAAPAMPTAPRRGLVPIARPDDSRPQALVGVLASTHVTVSFDNTPTRVAVDTLRDLVATPIIARYDDDRGGRGGGLDPLAPITLELSDRSALDVLEAILEQCVGTRGILGAASTSMPDGDAPTWQVRKGFVEVGTKDRLSVPGARERRLYYIADLIMDIPMDVDVRTRREVIALDVIREVVETIEPGAWDYGQPPPVEDEPEIMDDDVPRYRPATPPPAGAAESDAADTAGATGTGLARPPTMRRFVSSRYPALIRYWRDVLIIDAPDFVHRQLVGYVRPEPVD